LSRCGDAAYGLKQHFARSFSSADQPAWQESGHDRKVIDGIIAPSLVRRSSIAPIIIDGYNLIGIQHRDLRHKREELIQQLIAYKRLKGHDITVVFDGWKTGSHREEHAVTGGIRVIYSRLGDRADDVIRKIVSQERKEWIVITSDREIASHAWAKGAVPVSSDEFLRRLGQDTMDRGEVCENPRDKEGDRRERGNPRQPSKKEKALIRVLGKL
jgi:predicted RNA-binding protein with PIN domain